MLRLGKRAKLLCVCSLGLLTCFNTNLAYADQISSQGAKIYCFMRSNGNPHEVSWEGAYEVIKRQGTGLFKTSPKNAAVMIIQEVVNDPVIYPGCGSYLGDLFKNNNNVPKSYSKEEPEERNFGNIETERYSY